ncbi:MAG: choice-of-anchor R domain-containing protein [Planctomycetota bacterium]
MKIPVRVFVPLLALAMAVAAGAQDSVTLISNLDGNDGTQAADLDNLRNKGMGFTMPAGLDYFLDRAILRLETFGANVQPIVEIWDDVAGLPSSMLIRLNNPTFGASGIANYVFVPPTPFALAPSVTYWLVAYGTATGDRFDWKASSPAQVPTGLATHFGTKFDANGPPPTGASSILCSYAIEGTVIPEPSAGLALALALVGALRRR